MGVVVVIKLKFIKKVITNIIFQMHFWSSFNVVQIIITKVELQFNIFKWTEKELWCASRTPSTFYFAYSTARVSRIILILI